MSRQKRALHQDFVDYEVFIVKHANYASLPNKFGPAGEIRWVSPSDKLRAAWWDEQKSSLDLKNRAEVARHIHPKELKGYKPCQVCGEMKSIYYIYPNKSSLAKINKAFDGFNFQPYLEEVEQIMQKLLDKKQINVYKTFREIFKVPATIPDDIAVFAEYVKQARRGVSPGVMSNAPDRLDGFHTYNVCCRGLQDTGRHSSNLARYSQDRRVYENWAEGNWKLSNGVMNEYKRFAGKIICPGCGQLKKITADHIGPISLGFTHRPKFNPLCSSCNSQKNNRMTYADIVQLKVEEKTGEQVVSWHSKYIWDELKGKVNGRYGAVILSKLMRDNLHRVLIILSIISENGYDEFLRTYLHPEHAFKSYKFVGFDPLSGPKKIVEEHSNSANNRRNAERYVRISFEALQNYMKVENRNSKIWQSQKVDELMAELLHLLNRNEEGLARLKLAEVLARLAAEAGADFVRLVQAHPDEEFLIKTLGNDSGA